MAWGSVGSGSTTAGSGNNQASLVHTLQNNALSIGRVGVLTVAQDNASSIGSIDGGIVSTVTDAAGNIWKKAKEWQNGGGAVQGGAVCSMWWTQATANLSTGQNITITFLPGSSAAFDESASALWVFSVGAGSLVTVAAATANITSASSVLGSLDQTVSTLPGLRVRGVASESTIATGVTTSAGWTQFGSAAASASKAMSVRGEFLITASSTAASAPTQSAAADNASVYVVFQEIVNNPLSGAGAAAGDSVAGSSGIGYGYIRGSAAGDSVVAGIGFYTALALNPERLSAINIMCPWRGLLPPSTA